MSYFLGLLLSLALKANAFDHGLIGYRPLIGVVWGFVGPTLCDNTVLLVGYFAIAFVYFLMELSVQISDLASPLFILLVGSDSSWLRQALSTDTFFFKFQTALTLSIIRILNFALSHNVSPTTPHTQTDWWDCSLGDHLAECRHVPLGQVPSRKIENLIHFTELQILDDTWSSGQLVRALAQVTKGHLFKCWPPLGRVQGLVTHPSNIPDWTDSITSTADMGGKYP